MSGRVDVELKWHGHEIEKRFKRAIARGTIGVGERVAAQATRGVHKISGDLGRSIHTAKARSVGEQRVNQQNVLTAEGALLDVGSWLDYACVEESRGGSHQYMMPAVQAVSGTTFVTFKAAFTEEGFRA